MIITTTPTIEGRPASEHLGIVSGQFVNGMSLLGHLLERIRGIFGGQSPFHKNEVIETREAAVREMVTQAEALGADAIVGFGCSYSMISGGRVVLIVASGTAVKLAKQ